VVGNRFRLKALQAIHMYVQDITELDLFGVKVGFLRPPLHICDL
jgi:hypothetical protein